MPLLPLLMPPCNRLTVRHICNSGISGITKIHTGGRSHVPRPPPVSMTHCRGAKVMLLFETIKSYTYNLSGLPPYRFLSPVSRESVFVIRYVCIAVNQGKQFHFYLKASKYHSPLPFACDRWLIILALSATSIISMASKRIRRRLRSKLYRAITSSKEAPSLKACSVTPSLISVQ